MSVSQPVAAIQQAASTGAEHQQLPTHKLSYNCRASQPSQPVVIVGCGSYNPPSVMHMRMFELANDELSKVCTAAACSFLGVLPLHKLNTLTRGHL